MGATGLICAWHHWYDRPPPPLPAAPCPPFPRAAGPPGLIDVILLCLYIGSQVRLRRHAGWESAIARTPCAPYVLAVRCDRAHSFASPVEYNTREGFP